MGRLKDLLQDLNVVYAFNLTIYVDYKIILSLYLTFYVLMFVKKINLWDNVINSTIEGRKKNWE